MVDVKREDITLSGWTKGISADEFAGGSYFYSEAIDSGYDTKGFELGYRVTKTLLNNRRDGYPVALSPIHSHGFTAFTRDGRIEMLDDFYGENNGAYYAYQPSSDDGYLNGVSYGDFLLGIRESKVDIVPASGLFDPTSELLVNPDLTSATGWTLGTGWTTTDDGATHSSGTDSLTSDSMGDYSNSDKFRIALHISGWTAGGITVKCGGQSQTINERRNGWYVVTLRGDTAMNIDIKPTNSFDGTIEEVNCYQLDLTDLKTISINGGTLSDRHPAVTWEGDLYIACGHIVNIVSLSDYGVTYKELIDKDYEIMSMTQQAGNLIIWATNGDDSRQYYWNGVDAVATEVIEWKGLVIQCATGTETISYVLTTSASRYSSTGYEYRLYAVNGYQRSLIASKLYQYRINGYVEYEHYNKDKKFEFNNVSNDQSMVMYLDSLYIPGCDGVYKYGYDVPGLNTAWTRPIKLDTGAANIVMGQRGHILGVGMTLDNRSYLCTVDNRWYAPTGFLVTEGIYWDKLSTRKAIEKIKIGYKNVASTVGNIKIYAIVDDTYFWRFRPTSTPTTRPEVGDVYNVAHSTKAKVIAVDKTAGVITFVTIEDKGSYLNTANTTITKVSGVGDDSIVVDYNYDNMCLIKTIESEQQGYGADLVFGKDFVNNYLPYWHKINLVIELNSNTQYLSPEIYEISMTSDITDVVL